MRRPEYFISDLICAGADKILHVLVKPNISVDSVIDLTEEKIDELINDYDIKGIILDVDETIRFDDEEIPLEIESWIYMLKSKLKVIVVSNGLDKKIADKLEKMGIEYVTLAFKPLKRGFKKACDSLQLSERNIAVIGDDLFDDIHGGNRNNMMTIKVSGDKKLVKKLK